jgi:hypothetical protein
MSRVASIASTDTSDPRNDRDFFTSEQLANPYSRQDIGQVRGKGRTRYTLTVEVDGQPLPATEIAREQQALAQHLVAVRQQVLADYQAERKIVEVEALRSSLEGQLQDVRDAAERAHAQAVNLAGKGKGKDAAEVERAKLEAEEHARTLKAAIDQARTSVNVMAGLLTRLEDRLHSEAEKIRAEVLARYASACQWLALAVTGQEVPAEARGVNLLREARVTEALAQLVQSATPAQRSVFGSAVGWLDNQVTSLAMVPGYQRPRGVNENYSAPAKGAMGY